MVGVRGIEYAEVVGNGGGESGEVVDELGVGVGRVWRIVLVIVVLETVVVMGDSELVGGVDGEVKKGEEGDRV